MSLVADAFQPLFATGLAGLRGRPSGLTLADLIGKQQKVGFDLEFNEKSQTIITDFRDPSPVLSSLAFDGSRFASAAFQTIGRIPEQLGDSEAISWALIKAYYAAFYAGHGIIRLIGESCSFFDRGHVSRILALSQAYGRTPTFKVSASAYHCKIDVTSSKITSRSMREGTGGAHEAFWHLFGERINQIGEELFLGPLEVVEAQLVFSKLENLRQSLRSNGAPLHSWLSVVRNDIQYRHARNVWLPTVIRKQDRLHLGRLIAQWTRDPMEIEVGLWRNNPLAEFAVACAFVVAVCRTLLMRIADRSLNSSHSFARLGPLTVLRNLSMPVGSADDTGFSILPIQERPHR